MGEMADTAIDTYWDPYEDYKCECGDYTGFENAIEVFAPAIKVGETEKGILLSLGGLRAWFPKKYTREVNNGYKYEDFITPCWEDPCADFDTMEEIDHG